VLWLSSARVAPFHTTRKNNSKHCVVQQKEMASKQYVITAPSTTHTEMPSDWSTSVALSWQNFDVSAPGMMSHTVNNNDEKMNMKRRYWGGAWREGGW